MSDMFIYVFCENDRDYLLGKGYEIIKSNDAGLLYIFKNSDKLTFDFEKIKCVYSNILTF